MGQRAERAGRTVVESCSDLTIHSFADKIPLFCVFYSLIPDLCDSSSGEDSSSPDREMENKRNDSSASFGSISSGHLAAAEYHIQLQEAGLLSFKKRHVADGAAADVVAVAQAEMCDSQRPSLADTSLPYREAKPTVQVSVTAVDPQDPSSSSSSNDDDYANIDDPLIADISSLLPPRPSTSRSPDRKRVASSGPQSPPKRHARCSPDDFAILAGCPPRDDGDCGDGDGKKEEK